MIYVRTNFIWDSSNRLLDDEESKLSAINEENAFHEERESIKKTVKQDGDKYMKKVENIPFTDSEHDDWLQNRVYYFATCWSKSKALIYIIMFLLQKPSRQYLTHWNSLGRFKLL